MAYIIAKLNTGLGVDSKTLDESLEAVNRAVEAHEAAGWNVLARKENVAVLTVNVGAKIWSMLRRRLGAKSECCSTHC